MCNNFNNVFVDIPAEEENGTTSSLPVGIEEYNHSGLSENYAKVFVYDLDDLTKMSRERLEEGTPLSNQHAGLIKKLLKDAKLGHANLEDIANIMSVVDDGTEATRKMMENYEVFETTIDCLTKQYNERYVEQSDTTSDEEYNELVRHWKSVRQCLELVNRRSRESKTHKYANVVLSEDGVAHGAAQAFLSMLWSEIDIHNVYSTKTRSTETVLEMIRKRFGSRCQLVVVTSNGETVQAARKLLLPVMEVDSKEDFDALHEYQRDVWLTEEQEHQQPTIRKSWYELRKEQEEELKRRNNNEVAESDEDDEENEDEEHGDEDDEDDEEEEDDGIEENENDDENEYEHVNGDEEDENEDEYEYVDEDQDEQDQLQEHDQVRMQTPPQEEASAQSSSQTTSQHQAQTLAQMQAPTRIQFENIAHEPGLTDTLNLLRQALNHQNALHLLLQRQIDEQNELRISQMLQRPSLSAFVPLEDIEPTLQNDPRFAELFRQPR